MIKHHEVPTHLNVVDKVLFGLSVRQFLYLLVGSSATYSLWEQTARLGEAMRIACAVICLCTTLAFALVRPADRALEEWLVVCLVYLGTRRCSIWQPREPDPAAWRPAGAAWQELTPNLAWADEETACD
jgi:PrgI family protein